MKPYLFFLLCLIASGVRAQNLQSFLPDSVTYDPGVPEPKSVIHHEVGEWHVTHDRLVRYMEVVAEKAPRRVRLERMGFTYEGRPQVLLIITAPENHAKLESIRQQHLQLADPSRSSALNTASMPLVVYIGHSIHGNEPSGANAALLSAYYLAAAQGSAVDELLKNTVILFDPSFNPDGLQRFSTWANQHKSKALVTDPNSREFNEVWPGGRFNHYWFDLNRDWLPAQHVESQNRLRWFHAWKPNILTDHHEQGSNATFFFQPGVPSRVHPFTPSRNQELTAEIAKFHAAFLDRIGSLYFTKENYDDFYYGKGSTYPDVNGAVGILFEQASSRGHAQETANGLLKFPYTIRNQFVTTLSTLEAAKYLRRELLDWQREFYKSALAEATASPVKAYVIGDAWDRTRVMMFVDMLRRHEIDVYQLKNDLQFDGDRYAPGSAFIIPTHQPQYRLIRGIFEKTFQFKDSLFYDITSWTMPLAFGLNYVALNSSRFQSGMLGEKVGNLPLSAPKTKFIRSEYGYLVNWEPFYTPAALYQLQQAGVQVRVATNPFQMQMDGKRISFPAGTLQIPVSLQKLSSGQLYDTLLALSGSFDLNVHSLHTGTVLSGSDMGSSRFAALTKPVIATIVGQGVNALDAGEFWHLMDQRFQIPVSQLEPGVFNRADLSRYNTLVLVGGNYGELNKDKLKAWVQNGGLLILTEEAINWAAQNGIHTVIFKKQKPALDSTLSYPYSERSQLEGAQQMSGAIFKADVDLTHPLAYGYHKPYVSLFKANKVFMEKSRNPFATPYQYKADPLQSGWVSSENLAYVKNSAAVIVNTVGSGRVISIADNPNFRAFWLGGTKLMMNAVFFGKIIDAASGRVE